MGVGLVGLRQPSQAGSWGEWCRAVKCFSSLSRPQGWKESSFSKTSEPALGFGKSGHFKLWVRPPPSPQLCPELNWGS